MRRWRWSILVGAAFAMGIAALAWSGAGAIDAVDAGIGSPAVTSQCHAADVPILMYHHIGAVGDADVPPTLIDHQVTVDVDDFDAQVRWLWSRGYTPITFARLADFLERGTPLPQCPVILSFDDGYEEHRRVVLPILTHYGFFGTFFVFPGGLGLPGYMSWADVGDLRDAGMEIASHTQSHGALPVLDDASLAAELRTSRDTLERRLGVRIDALAYPFGLYDDRCVAAARAAGYRVAATTDPGSRQTTDRALRLRRIYLGYGQTLEDLKAALTWTPESGLPPPGLRIRR